MQNPNQMPTTIPHRHPPPPPEIEEQRPVAKRHGSKGNDMVPMLEQNEREHQAPVPGATPPDIDPFPRPILLALLAGLLAGGVAGAIFGWLLLGRWVVVPGWEQLYSLTPFTFGVFWTGMGAALGLLIAGAIAVFVVPPSPAPASPPYTREHEEMAFNRPATPKQA